MILSIKIIAVLVVLLQILYWNVIFRKVKEKKGAYPKEKKVTLIICVKNDWNKIKANQLQFNNLQGVDEIIFIDDHSIGGIPSDFEEIWQNKISKVFPNKGTGKKFALETGINLAQNDWILLTDADCIPATSSWGIEMAAFDPRKEIILGHAPYFKKKGLLNQFIRYENIINALTSFGGIEIGMTYNGVGRNLLYHKSVFDVNSVDLSIPYGDDDLLVNKKAKDHSSDYCLTAEAFIYTEAKKSYKEYFLQKWRHYATSGKYTISSQIYLVLYFMSMIGFYFTVVFLLFTREYIWASLLYAGRMTSLFLVLEKKLKLFREKDLLPAFIFLDAFYGIHLLLQMPLLLFPKKTW
ncbi:MAG: glycosyltransferase [Saprospiraceae bacterium]